MTRPLKPDVALSWTESRYPTDPESGDNAVHQALRAAWRGLGLDAGDPFRGMVQPGGTVLLKPNFVRDYHPRGLDLESLITHPAVIFAVADFAARALRDKGTIVIADAPLQNTDFAKIREANGFDRWLAAARKRHPGITFVVEDWRLTTLNYGHWLSGWTKAHGQEDRDRGGEENPGTHEVVDRGTDSFLEDVSDRADRFRVTYYKPSLLLRHHAPGKHEYLVTKRIFDADLMINLPKLKTHIKAGVTGGLKNLIGINGHKEYLPHHIVGSSFEGGDNYAMPNMVRRWYEALYDRYWEHFTSYSQLGRQVRRAILKALWLISCAIGSESISAGSWHGNDTIWRTTLDLNHILYFTEGRSPERIITVVDGIVAGQGDGPLNPDPRPLGAILVGENPATVDAVIAHLVGYNPARVATVFHALADRRSRFGGIAPDAIPVREIKAGNVANRRAGELAVQEFVLPRYWENARRAD